MIVLFQGFSFPAMHALLSKWAPVEERSTMTTIVYAGDTLMWPLPVE
jgi:sugar phosphate permease